MTKIDRKKILAGNWKMNLGPAQAGQYFNQLTEILTAAGNREIKSERVIFPPAYALGSEIQWLAAKCNTQLGGQNIHWEPQGAFTGELSAKILKEIGLFWALVGHSERRQYFGDTNETTGKRLLQGLKCGLRVLFCIGESLAERESGKMEAVLESQLESYVEALAKFVADQQPSDFSARHVPLAYEPVWAIGTGKTATDEQAQEAHKFIREFISSKLGATFAAELPILYGGSVTPENVTALLNRPDVDGVLVGGASLKPESFAKILLAW